jgi:hypothetical protein
VLDRDAEPLAQVGRDRLGGGHHGVRAGERAALERAVERALRARRELGQEALERPAVAQVGDPRVSQPAPEREPDQVGRLVRRARDHTAGGPLAQ